MAKIAVLMGDEFEDSEYAKPVARLRKAGHEIEVLGEKKGAELEGKRGDEKVRVDRAVASADPNDYDALLIPGGHSPDHLRIHEPAVKFVKRFDGLRRPMAVVCHGPQLLIEAGVAKGRRMTSWPSVRTDLRNAGAEVVDEEVVEDGHLITSRKPDDLDAFSDALLRRLDRKETQRESAPPAE